MDLQTPVQTVYKRTTISSILTAYLTALLTNTTWIKLYQNNVVPSDQTNISDLQEATFGGYAKVAVGAFSAVNLDGGGNAYALSPLAVFQCDGTSGNTIYGAYLSTNDGTTATATNAGNAGNYSGAFVITAGGSGYQSAPTVYLTGATGADAAAHAVISGGAVTAIVLDNPGNGAYTTYTVVIDPPEQLVCTSPFGNPVNVTLATDAIPYVQEMEIPAITA